MPTSLRIASFNLENLDDDPGDSRNPSLDERIAILRPQLERLRADVICFQEINGQEAPGQPRRLLALERLLAGTRYASGFHTESTTLADGSQVRDERNLVIVSRFPFQETRQIRNDIVPAPAYRRVTAVPPDPENDPFDVRWERAIFYGRLALPDGVSLHVLNLHLKSRIPSNVPGQRRADGRTWRSAAGNAEGSFISAMKRVGQSLETRVFIDQIFDADPDARIVVCGDLNEDLDEVAVTAIRGDVENTENSDLVSRVMIPCERTVPEPSRFSLLHQGQKAMLDHILVSRPMLSFYRGTEIHNEILHDESIAFAFDIKFPESDHAPVVAEFEIP